MSTVTSYTLLSRPAISRTGLQPGKQAAATAVSLPWVRNKLSPLSVCHVQKRQYDISPFALVHPKFPPTLGEHWDITEDEEHINLKFYVSPTTKDKLLVRTKDNVLVIKHKGEDGDNPASSLDVRLLMPFHETDVEAKLNRGWLLVNITKPHDEKDKPFTITDAP